MEHLIGEEIPEQWEIDTLDDLMSEGIIGREVIERQANEDDFQELNFDE